jgi:transcription initiation factor TFIIIB Brf1 subunit/transcription initiation factor TFIIB
MKVFNKALSEYDVKEKDISFATKAYKKFKNLGICPTFTPPYPSDVLESLEEDMKRKLEISDTIINGAKEILKTYEKDTTIATPTTEVAGALYIASFLKQERIRQEDLADFFGITMVSVRNGYNKQLETLYSKDKLDELKDSGYWEPDVFESLMNFRFKE